jgi:hypothetical protein
VRVHETILAPPARAQSRSYGSSRALLSALRVTPVDDARKRAPHRPTFILRIPLDFSMSTDVVSPKLALRGNANVVRSRPDGRRFDRRRRLVGEHPRMRAQRARLASVRERHVIKASAAPRSS